MAEKRTGVDKLRNGIEWNRSYLISGGTEWICLALSRRGMDANCREMDKRSRAVKRNRIAMSGNVWSRSGNARCRSDNKGEEAEQKRRATRREGNLKLSIQEEKYEQI